MKYQTKIKDKVQCNVCPRNCILANGQEGFCHVRKNIDGKIVLTTYGYNTGLTIDPMEKKPLYHFYPGSSVLSFGTFGCNMGCQFCQNWTTTKTKSDYNILQKISPQEIADSALEYECKSVAFTYNDPIIFLEYQVDTAKLCQEKGVKTVAVTSGFINPEPAKEFFKYIDAVNIDLKGFSENFYKKNCLAKLQPVLNTIKYVHQETNCWLELTTLLIEGENDSNDELKQEYEWILENLGSNVPVHLSAFFPNYKFMDKKPTSAKTLFRAYNLALDMGLNYVYTGNIPNIETSSTFCKNCKKPIIIRDGYKILKYELEEGKCIYCGTKCDGFFD